jgi:anti-anti-sigma regulatory factor
MALFRLSDFGTAFATRGRGRELREELLDGVGDGAAVTVDFEGVTNVSYSFADEFTGKLVEAGDVELRLENMPPGVARVVERAVERRAGVRC